MNAIIDQLANGLATGLVYALVAAGLSLLFKGLDTVNFAHGEFYVLGGVAVFVVSVQLGLPPWTGVLLAIAAMVVVGAVLHAMLVGVLKQSPLNVLMATFAVSLIISNLVSFAFRGIPQPVPPFIPGALEVGPVVIANQRLLAAALSLVVLVGLIAWLRWSRIGRSLRAVADNREGARVIGIDTVRVDRIIFVIASVTAALAGALLAPVTQVSPFGGLPVMVTAFVVVVLGGVGSVVGALIGGVVLGVAEALTVAIAGTQWESLVGYVLLLVVMLFRGPIEQRIRMRKRVAA